MAVTGDYTFISLFFFEVCSSDHLATQKRLTRYRWFMFDPSALFDWKSFCRMEPIDLSFC